MNCKPGDMAVLVQSYTRPQSVGCILEVLSGGGDGALGYWWHCRMVTAAPTLQGYGLPGTEGGVYDHQLRPIRPGDLEDDTPTDLPLEVEA